MNLIIENDRSGAIPCLLLPTLEHVTVMPIESTETDIHTGKTPGVLFHANRASMIYETEPIGNTYL